MPTALQSVPEWLQIALLLVPALGATLAAAALMLNVQQWRRNGRQTRATMVAACLREFATDEEMQGIFYAIEYSRFKYTDDFHGSELERPTDKLLRHFANLALAWQANLLCLSDVLAIRYYVLRIVSDAEIQKYLTFLSGWVATANLGEHPYGALLQMGRALAKHQSRYLRSPPRSRRG